MPRESKKQRNFGIDAIIFHMLLDWWFQFLALLRPSCMLLLLLSLFRFLLVFYVEFDIEFQSFLVGYARS